METNAAQPEEAAPASQMVPSAAPAAPPAAVPGPGAWELGELQEQAQQHEQMMKQYFASQAQAEALRKFWTDQLAEAQAHRESLGDFKNQQLPLARIKKIMKSDEDVRMISAEAPVVFAKACEMFILELTMRTWNVAKERNHRTVTRADVATAVTRTEVFDFLVDVVPREGPEPAGGEGGVALASVPSFQLPPPPMGPYPPLGTPYLPPPGGLIPAPGLDAAAAAAVAAGGSVQAQQQQQAAQHLQSWGALPPAMHPGLMYPYPPGMWPPCMPLLQQPLPPGMLQPPGQPAQQQQPQSQQNEPETQ